MKNRSAEEEKLEAGEYETVNREAPKCQVGKRRSYEAGICRYIRRAADFLLSLLFPTRCPYCGAVVGFTVCRACLCAAKGARRSAGEAVAAQGRCFAPTAQAFAPFWYVPPVQNAILRMKNNGALGADVYFARQMEAALPNLSTEQKPEFYLPVPGYRGERRGRENLPRKLAKQLARSTSVPMLEHVLCKVRHTERQMTLQKEARSGNVKGAYAVAPEKAAMLAGKCVWLVDDVLTTGSTLHECATAVLQAGARSCCAVCLAVTCAPEEQNEI